MRTRIPHKGRDPAKSLQSGGRASRATYFRCHIGGGEGTYWLLSRSSLNAVIAQEVSFPLDVFWGAMGSEHDG